MTIQERKKEIFNKIDNLSEKKLNYLMSFLEEIEKQDEKYIKESDFEKLLQQDLEQYKEVWKKLA